MKIRDYALTCEGGWLDTDVTDKDIDMLVAFVWDAGSEIKDEYDRFLSLLANNVEVLQVPNEKYNMICDFSGYFRNFNDELKELYDRAGWCIDEEFDEDEIYYDFVLALEGLISGYSNEKTYREINKMLMRD